MIGSYITHVRFFLLKTAETVIVLGLMFNGITYSFAEELPVPATPETSVVAEPTPEAIPTPVPKAPVYTRAQIEEKVKKEFPDDPLMWGIAKCESTFRQFADSGNPLRGAGRYIGIFQIDEFLHKDKAASLGHDIFTVDGNIGYAKYLFKKEGARPWGCRWKAQADLDAAKKVEVKEEIKTDVVVPSETPKEEIKVTPTDTKTEIPAPKETKISSTVTSILRFGMKSDEVRELQKILNKSGYPVALSGEGSKGSETTLFGGKTLEAVKKFQCEKKIACVGSLGYGTVGPKTRGEIAKL